MPTDLVTEFGLCAGTQALLDELRPSLNRICKPEVTVDGGARAGFTCGLFPMRVGTRSC
jgi:hypothetical protein